MRRFFRGWVGISVIMARRSKTNLTAPKEELRAILVKCLWIKRKDYYECVNHSIKTHFNKLGFIFDIWGFIQDSY